MPRTARKKQGRMLPLLLGALLVVLCLILLLPSPEASEQKADDTLATTLVKAGDPAPDFTVGMLDGGRVTLSELRGQVVLVTFWATWCPPCRQELGHVQHEIIDRFAGRPFRFLPISRGEDSTTVGKFRAKNAYTFDMGLDPDRAVYDCFASNYIPRNFLIGKDGRVAMTTVGFDKDEFRRLIETAEHLLNE